MTSSRCSAGQGRVGDVSTCCIVGGKGRGRPCWSQPQECHAAAACKRQAATPPGVSMRCALAAGGAGGKGVVLAPVKPAPAAGGASGTRPSDRSRARGSAGCPAHLAPAAALDCSLASKTRVQGCWFGTQACAALILEFAPPRPPSTGDATCLERQGVPSESMLAVFGRARRAAGQHLPAPALPGGAACRCRPFTWPRLLSVRRPSDQLSWSQPRALVCTLTTAQLAAARRNGRRQRPEISHRSCQEAGRGAEGEQGWGSKRAAAHRFDSHGAAWHPILPPAPPPALRSPVSCGCKCNSMAPRLQAAS